MIFVFSAKTYHLPCTKEDSFSLKLCVERERNHDFTLYYMLKLLADIFLISGDMFFLKCQNDALNDDIYQKVVRFHKLCRVFIIHKKLTT